MRHSFTHVRGRTPSNLTATMARSQQVGGCTQLRYESPGKLRSDKESRLHDSHRVETSYPLERFRQVRVGYCVAIVIDSVSHYLQVSGAEEQRTLNH